MASKATKKPVSSAKKDTTTDKKPVATTGKAKNPSVSKAVQLICDNFYKVDIDHVVVEELLPDSDNLKFVNPRKLDTDDNESCAGLGEEDIAELQESIRTKGLLTPLHGRIVDGGKVSLINGHRRYSAIKKLVESNVPCYDPEKKTQVDAISIYKMIPFKIFDVADEFECYILSFEEDKTKVKFGPGTEAKFVQHCRSRFVPDEKILQMTGNSQEWLNSTYELLDMLLDDHAVLNAFFSGNIDRGLAKVLAEISDVEKRHEIMRKAIDSATERYLVKMERYDTAINAKLDKKDSAEAQKVVAEHEGNKEAADEKQAQIEKLDSEITKIKKKRNVSAPRAGVSDLKKAVRKGKSKKDEKASNEDDGDDENEKILPAATRISSVWPEFFKKIISNGGVLPENEEISMPDVLARYSVALLKVVDDRKGKPEEFAKTWIKKFASSGLKDD